MEHILRTGSRRRRRQRTEIPANTGLWRNGKRCCLISSWFRVRVPEGPPAAKAATSPWCAISAAFSPLLLLLGRGRRLLVCGRTYRFYKAAIFKKTRQRCNFGTNRLELWNLGRLTAHIRKVCCTGLSPGGSDQRVMTGREEREWHMGMPVQMQRSCDPKTLQCAQLPRLRREARRRGCTRRQRASRCGEIDCMTNTQDFNIIRMR